MKRNKPWKVFFYTSCGFIGGALLSIHLWGDDPIKQKIEEKVTHLMPNIPIWYDNGTFFDITKECVIDNWVGWTGIAGMLAILFVVIFKWNHIKKLTKDIVSKIEPNL